VAEYFYKFTACATENGDSLYICRYITKVRASMSSLLLLSSETTITKNSN
jgi:hypothetical protein